MRNDVSIASQAAFIIIQGKTPIKTGNLRYNAVKYNEEENKAEIYVEETIAPYMPYTNEVWISPRWRGRQNPNLYWWNKSVDLAIQAMAIILNGEVIKV